MDLSFEGENNFPLPEPAGKLDFTEDEDQSNRNKNTVQNDEQCVEAMNVSMNEEVNDEESDEDANQQEDQFVEVTETFNKPIINQNLMLNKNRINQAKNMIYNSQNGLKEPVTPALIKRKQFKPWFNSPTDNCLSPCTQKIFKQKKPC